MLGSVKHPHLTPPGVVVKHKAKSVRALGQGSVAPKLPEALKSPFWAIFLAHDLRHNPRWVLPVCNLKLHRLVKDCLVLTKFHQKVLKATFLVDFGCEALPSC